MQTKKFTILIVDDTPGNIAILHSVLRDEYKIKAAPNGERALTLARQDPPPDLILLDIMMPEMDGYEVCQQLKADPHTAEIPIIFVSSKNEAIDESQGLALGAIDYITKPIKPMVVQARVRTHLKLWQMQVELEQKNKALEEAAKLRDDVEQIMRHDLKTPLNSIIVLPNILRLSNTLSEADNKILIHIEQAGRKMLEMINRSLDLYKMEIGTYPLTAEPLNILPILSTAAREAALAVTGKQWCMRLHEQPVEDHNEFWVIAEEMLCYPMFYNLIQNAFEASPTKGTVEIDITQNKPWAEIRITNDGIVPESIHNKFFDKYVTFGKKTGTGLGTYSAKLCAETQNGKISMSSLDGKRTCITVCLPISANN
ncbi:hypothetical protein TI05_01490 [Achromatium sp. WMS3]|nr:hypothetical protein TI05_01490 [Achromatium sp. WMS3]